MKTRATHFVLATIAILGMQHAAEAQTMRLSIKRVWGGTANLPATAAAPAVDWVPTTQTIMQMMNTMVGDANTIFANNTNLLPGTPNVVLDPQFEFIDLLDPGYPFSFYDVDLGNSLDKKHALEAACEIDPARFAYRPDAINVYLVNTLQANGVYFGGYCSFPLGVNQTQYYDEDDLIFLACGTTSPPYFNPLTRSFVATALAHEVGHYFGLLHTYESSQTPACQPLSCQPDTTGDMVADTPLDNFNYTSISNAYLGTCSGSLATLLTNPMASYFSVPNIPLPPPPYSSAFSFTCGQYARMQPTINARARVWSPTPASISSVTINGPTSTSIDYTAQSASTQATLNLSGMYLPDPALGLVDVTVGRIKKTGSTLSFVPELASISTSATIPGSDILATFPLGIVLPPGLHTVCVRTGTVNSSGITTYQTVAYLDNAIEVTPWIDIWSAGTTPPTEAYTLVIRAAQSAGTFLPIYGWLGTETPASTSSYPTGVSISPNSYELLLNLANTQLQMLNFPSTSFAGMTFNSSPSGLAVAEGLRFFLQYAQFDPTGVQLPELSNVIEFAVP